MFRQVAGKEDMISVFLHRGQLCAVYTHGLHKDNTCDWDVATDWGNTSAIIGQVIRWLRCKRPEQRFYK